MTELDRRAAQLAAYYAAVRQHRDELCRVPRAEVRAVRDTAAAGSPLAAAAAEVLAYS